MANLLGRVFEVGAADGCRWEVAVRTRSKQDTQFAVTGQQVMGKEGRSKREKGRKGAGSAGGQMEKRRKGERESWCAVISFSL